MKNLKISCIVFILSIIAIACDTDKVAPRDVDLGKDYVVLEIGHFVSYNVKEIQYALNQPPKTVTYQLREVVENAFIDQSGKQSYRIVRYTRANGRQNWQIVNVWAARTDFNGAVRTEENIPFLKLTFPFEELKMWDGNTFNDLGRETYQMRDLGKRYRFDFKNYDETITVIQNRDSNLVNKDFRTEVFAKGIGMIYRKSDKVAYCQDRNQNCLGKAIIESGLVVEQSIFDTGVLK
jgi:hypothetical protein